MQKVKKIFLSPLYLSVALLALSACGEPPEPPFDGKYINLGAVFYEGNYQDDHIYSLTMHDFDFSDGDSCAYSFDIKV